MMDLRVHLGGARDRDQFIEALQESIAFTAHVRGVAAAVFAGRAHERDQLIRLGIRAGGVNEGAAHSQCAFAQRLPYQILHPGEFRGSWSPIGVAQLVHAHRRSADEGGDIGGDPLGDELIEEFTEGIPGDLIVDIGLGLEHLCAARLGEGAERVAFSEDFERDALFEIAQAAAVVDQ